MEDALCSLLVKITTGYWACNGVPRSELTDDELGATHRLIAWGWARWDADDKFDLLFKATPIAFTVKT